MWCLLIFLQLLCKLSESDQRAQKERLVNCIVEGEITFAKPFKPIFLSLPISDQDATDRNSTPSNLLLVQKLSSFRKWPMIVVNISDGSIANPIHYAASPENNYILYFRHEGEFANTMKALLDNNLLNQHSNFLIVTSTHFQVNTTRVVFEIFRVLQQFQILNCVLLIADSKKTNLYNLYTSMPFENSECKFNATPNVKLIDQCVGGQYKLGAKWYDIKVPKLFSSCTLDVVYADIPPYVIDMDEVMTLPEEEFTEHGLEVGILTNIFNYMNITLRFVESDSLGNLWPNKTVTGSLKMLYDREVDVAIGGYTPAVEKFPYFDSSFSYMTESLVWVTPHEHIDETDIAGLANIIRPDVYLAIFVMVVVVALTIIFLAKRREDERSSFKHPSDIIQTIFLTTFSLSVVKLPRSASVRAPFSMILLFALILNAAYTTYLVSVLAQSGRYQEKYQNSSDILRYNLTTYIWQNSHRFFQINTTVDYKIVHNSTTCYPSEHYDCLTDIAIYKNAALLAPKEFVLYSEDFYLSPTHTRLLLMLPHTIVTYQVIFYMSKGFWGLARVNTLLNNAVDTGLTKKWKVLPKNENYYNKTTIVENSELSAGKNTMDFRDLSSVFYLMIAGHLLSCLVFVIELLVFYYKTGN